MQPLSALVADVLGQLKLAEQLRPEDCQLLLRGKPLDLSTPLRFANIGRDKLELRTGAALHLGLGVEAGGSEVGWWQHWVRQSRQREICEQD